MKIRKLILRAKIEQIEKQYNNIFIYHCSGNAAQWRLLKNFLYNEALRATSSAQLDAVCPVSLRSTSSRREHSERAGFTFYQSTNFKKKLLLTGGLWPQTLSRCGKMRTHSEPSSSSTYNKNRRVSGCLFFFEALSRSGLDTDQSSVWSELVKKIESLESKNDLILLYGQMKSTTVNHVDIKQALNLDTRTVYQQLLFSMQSATLALGTQCLQHHRDEFFRIQETCSPGQATCRLPLA